MSHCRWTLPGVAWFLVAIAPQVQADGEPDPLFRSDRILDVRISAPFTTILAERPEDEEAGGRFQYLDESGTLTEVDVGIRTRGRFRRQEEVCLFPPLRLNFKTSQTKKSLFHKQDKVKLVTHCQDDSSRYEQTLLREFVAYRILNALTDNSFRVRLLRITYVDTEGKDSDRERYGFLIEHEDRLAKRMGVTRQNIERTRIKMLRPDYLNLISMFHYLIGNTDFSPILGAEETCCHNHVLLGNEGELMYSVPYDFDQSGLVNAPHGVTNPRFKLRNAKERLYRGRCVNNAYLDSTIALFLERRDAIIAVSGEQEGIETSTNRAISSFIARFYKTIESPRRVRSEFLKKCI